ncbi:MAG: patatin-like phospholipase family protein [Saprospiraceae bacterium]
MHNSDRIALVFSGGGARGAYQIGFWKALETLRLTSQVVAVYGTSVGAINSAAFIQGDVLLAEKLWEQLNYQKIFQNMPQPSRKRFSRRFYTMARKAIKEKGLDVSPLKKLLRDTLDEKLIRESHLDFGLVVFDWTHKRPIYMTKEDIPDGHLIEYVIASSTFPVFQPHRIGSNIYIDGGVYDNRPLSFCQNRKDIDKVICIDVTMARHFWPNKKKKMSGQVKFIRPSRLLGSPMAFDNARIQKNIKLGYEDTLIQLEQMSAKRSGEFSFKPPVGVI